MVKKTSKPPEDTRPAWLQLLDLESSKQPYQSARRSTGRQPGRPRNPFPRKAVNITLTDDEVKMLDGLVELLGANIQGIKRGTLVGFMTYLLDEQLKGKDLAQVKLFSDLADLLAQQTKGKTRKLKSVEAAAPSAEETREVEAPETRRDVNDKIENG